MDRKHPPQRLIALYAAGDATEGVSLAFAAHLTYCPACRARVAAAEAMAAALMPQDVPEIAPPAFDAILPHLSQATETEAVAPAIADAGPLPTAVAERVGIDFASIPWRFRLPGVSEHVMTSDEGDSISLLRVRPGVKIPQHTHEGEELTVVFSGVLEDGGTSYGVGDMSVADHDVDHHPRAGGDETCICLAVVSGGLRFTGTFGRALNLFS